MQTIAPMRRGWAGAMWGVCVSIHVEIHRSGNITVNHITNIVLYMYIGPMWTYYMWDNIPYNHYKWENLPIMGALYD